MIFISSGLLSAIKIVIETRASFEITGSSLTNKQWFLYKYSKNKVAAILLHPSIKGWSFTKKI